MTNEKFVVCVDGICAKDGRVLLVKRNVEPFKGFWHVVGGQVEDNETLEKALVREFKEETNLDIEVGDIITARIEKTFDRTKIVIAFNVFLIGGQLKLNSENTAYGWFHKFPGNSVYDYLADRKIL